MFFVWLIFSAVCLCLYCCVLHIRTREARLVTYEATFSVSCLCVLRDRASRSPHPCLWRLHFRGFFSAIHVPHVTHAMSLCGGVTRQFLFRLHNRASATTLLCIQVVCTRASRTPIRKSYLCDESRNSVPVYAAVLCVLYLHSLVSGDTLAVTLRACGARRPSVRGCGGCDSSCLCFYTPVPLDTLKLWLFHFYR